jgi:hypothetical protein
MGKHCGPDDARDGGGSWLRLYLVSTASSRDAWVTRRSVNSLLSVLRLLDCFIFLSRNLLQLRDCLDSDIERARSLLAQACRSIDHSVKSDLMHVAVECEKVVVILFILSCMCTYVYERQPSLLYSVVFFPCVHIILSASLHVVFRAC